MLEPLLSAGYVLADLSGRYTPIEWARTAVAAYRAHGADRVVAEVNNGGEMVEATLRVVDDNIAYTAVHASRGKVVRAEPVAALYEQGRIRHMGAFTQLEDQMCEFTPLGTGNGLWAAHCRQHDCAGALDLLRRASELARTNAGYAYVYAVALNSGRCVRTGNGTAQ